MPAFKKVKNIIQELKKKGEWEIDPEKIEQNVARIRKEFNYANEIAYLSAAVVNKIDKSKILELFPEYNDPEHGIKDFGDFLRNPDREMYSDFLAKYGEANVQDEDIKLLVSILKTAKQLTELNNNLMKLEEMYRPNEGLFKFDTKTTDSIKSVMSIDLNTGENTRLTSTISALNGVVGSSTQLEDLSSALSSSQHIKEGKDSILSIMKKKDGKDIIRTFNNMEQFNEHIMKQLDEYIKTKQHEVDNKITNRTFSKNKYLARKGKELEQMKLLKEELMLVSTNDPQKYYNDVSTKVSHYLRKLDSYDKENGTKTSKFNNILRSDLESLDATKKLMSSRKLKYSSSDNQKLEDRLNSMKEQLEVLIQDDDYQTAIRRMRDPKYEFDDVNFEGEVIKLTEKYEKYDKMYEKVCKYLTKIDSYKNELSLHGVKASMGQMLKDSGVYDLDEFIQNFNKSDEEVIQQLTDKLEEIATKKMHDVSDDYSLEI